MHQDMWEEIKDDMKQIRNDFNAYMSNMSETLKHSIDMTENKFSDLFKDMVEKLKTMTENLKELYDSRNNHKEEIVILKTNLKELVKDINNLGSIIREIKEEAKFAERKFTDEVDKNIKPKLNIIWYLLTGLSLLTGGIISLVVKLMIEKAILKG